MINHGFLHGMQFTIPAQTFDRDEFLAIERRQKLNAGIDGAYSQVIAVTIQFREHNSARAAITFGAAFFGAGTAQVFAEKLQYCSIGINAGEFDDFPIEHKPNRVGLCVDAR